MSKRHENAPLLPAYKAEGEALLKELNEKLQKLDPTVTLVGYFNIDNPDSCTFFPTSDAACVMLTRDTFQKPEKFETTVVPIIEDNGVAYIGGAGWFYSFHDGRRYYTRERKAGAQTFNPRKGQYEFARNKPVGIIKDLKAAADSPSALRFSSFQDVHLLKVLNQMVDDADRLTPQKTIKAPKLLLPVSGHMRLRRGMALDNLVLDCAVKGLWANGHTGNFVRNNCKVKGIDENIVEARTPILGGNIADGEVDPDFKVEDGHVVEEFHNPEGKASRAIANIFGVSVRVKLYSILKPGEEAELFTNQTVFVPLPKAEYSIAQLKARPDWEALCYLAVLSGAEQRGSVEYVDYAVVIGDGTTETCVHIPDAEPIQKLRTTGREASGAKRFQAHALRVSHEHAVVDLSRIPMKAHIQQIEEWREKAEKEAKRKPAKAKRAPQPQQQKKPTPPSPLLSEVAKALMSPPEKVAELIRNDSGLLRKAEPYDFNNAIPGLTAPSQAEFEAMRAEPEVLQETELALVSPDGKDVIKMYEAPAAVPEPVVTPVSSPGQVVAIAPVPVVERVAPPMPAMPAIPTVPQVELPTLSPMEFAILRAAPEGGGDFVRFFLVSMAQHNAPQAEIMAALTKLQLLGLIVCTEQTIKRIS